MHNKKIHFIFEKHREPYNSFAQTMISALGQTEADKADVVVTVGGDGLLLQALRDVRGKPIYGITPPGAPSKGFWTDHSVKTPKDLLRNLERAEDIALTPLRAEITFANGNKRICHAFNDVAIERKSGQSVLMNFTADFSGNETGPHRIMGDGLLFSTAMGSTAASRSYGGPAVDIHNDVIILTGKGIYEPRGIAPIVTHADSSHFHVGFGDAASKRPVRIAY
ncbi:MAG: hypothetical protein OXT65_02440, partial [Alphaproteobacteria bacterium]|nr:hypothetical protein [Alphaproteobacteria bacterium]